MADSSTPTLAGPGRVIDVIPAPAGDPKPEAMTMGTGEAARLIGVDPRTIERWVDEEKIRGGRPMDPTTKKVVKGSHRWVDAEHAVLYAVGANRTHLIPDQWKRFIPQGFLPTQATRT